MGPARQQFKVPYVVVASVAVNMAYIMLARYPAALAYPSPPVREHDQSVAKFNDGVAARAIAYGIPAPGPIPA